MGYFPRIWWSPDSKRLALIDGDNNLWVMESDGTKPRQLNPEYDSHFLLQWSPDGSKITWASYSSATEAWTYFTCKLPEGELTRLPGGEYQRYQRSRDGTIAAYYLRKGDKTEVWLATAPQDQPKKLFDWGKDRRLGKYTLSTSKLSPDGKLLAAVFENGLSIFSLSVSSILKSCLGWV